MKKSILITISIVVGIFLVVLVMQIFTPLKIFDKAVKAPTPDDMRNEAPAAPSAEKKLNIFMRAGKFVPSQNAMPVGTEVTWINEDSRDLIVSGDGWTSGPLKPGEKFVKIFDAAGKYQYKSSYWKNMNGALTIQ